MAKQKVICIVGPTASGKTALSLEICEALGGEIVSADSMQIYKGMDIGTAKATAEERARAPHHMTDIVSPNENYSVARYVNEASAVIAEIAGRGKMPVIVGGTGLYVDSLMRGTGFAPEGGNEEIRRELLALAEEKGSEHVHSLLREADPERAAQIHPNNVKRVVRALEVYKLSGKTITEHDAETKKAESPYDALFLGIMFSDRERLYERINRRVDAMIEQGLVSEVAALLELGVPREATAMQAIGYKELCGYLAGECSLDDAAESIKQATRRYAKRQMTWFKRNKDILWFDAAKSQDFSDIIQASRSFAKA